VTTPDYPLLVLPSHEMYQVAHIATYIADALARHRAAGNRNGRRWLARRDIAGGRTAYDRALRASAPTPPDGLPRPIDATTYRAAREIVTSGPREAEVVSLEPTGRSGWAVVGQVPGIGPVGAVTPSKAVADAIRQHILSQPIEELTPWQVTRQPMSVPNLPHSPDLAAFVENLDPRLNRSRAVARHLRGLDSRVDMAIRGRFAGIDLDAPLVVTPPATPASTAAQQPAQRQARRSVRHICGMPPQSTGQPVTARAPSVPSSSAGP
jgi:hypothetical protein